MWWLFYPSRLKTDEDDYDDEEESVVFIKVQTPEWKDTFVNLGQINTMVDTGVRKTMNGIEHAMFNVAMSNGSIEQLYFTMPLDECYYFQHRHISIKQ